MAREMKYSGVKWIGEIPHGWKLVKVKYVSNIASGTTPASNIEDYWDGEIRWITPADFKTSEKWIKTGRRNITEKGRQASHLTIFPTSSVIFSKRAPIGQVGITTEKLCINQGCLGCITNEIISPTILYYLLSVFTEQFELLGSGTTFKEISATKFASFSIPLPPFSEQKAIADFLDKKCAEIDGLLADLEAEVKTLAEYKKSIIAETVTRGLNPNASMKQSGIPWAETIPAHWDIHPVYYYFTQRIHKNIFGIEHNLLSLSYGNIIRKDINTTGGLLPASYNTYNIVEANDIVIRPTDLQNDKKSLRTGFVREHGIITSAYITLQPKENIHSPYFHYLLHSYDIKKVFYNMGNGVRQGLNYSEFSRLMVFEPPIEEQKIIAEFLDEKCAVIDKSITDKNTQIETLKSYKSSLIYEYVTGKKTSKLKYGNEREQTDTL